MSEPVLSGMIDWTGLLRACALLGVAPHKAWQLSLVEWRALAGCSGSSAPLQRSTLEDLIQRFPDKPSNPTRRSPS
jgi:uncharacterized phage protein (TIGR02216 family)